MIKDEPIIAAHPGPMGGATQDAPPLAPKMEAKMQNSIHTKGEKQSRLPNPILDLAIAGVEMQMKAWQAYQIESARFVAKRLQANLAFLQSVGHCGDAAAMSECQRVWFADCRKDYAEKWGRLIGTSFALGLTDLAGLGRFTGRPATKSDTQQFEARPAAPPQRQRTDLAA
ncbi:MAG: hypothetical protein FJX44_03180 [Alphaproteobacteria bacterium]|nr:hypothetical protein [Alphaproteobacteria bacterium]